ncbi:MAG TPA: T9SS type A sorting domain-containing protein [Flavobacteriales bacterium]|nr:T9SS type A sorting domain-containing protein [Flavobacteriales bacterium]
MPQTASSYTLFHGDTEYSYVFNSLSGYWNTPAGSIAPAGTAYWGPSAGSLFAGQFPNANWLLKETPPGTYRYRYYSKSSGGISLVGEVVPGHTTYYSIPRSILFFPMYEGYESFGGYQIDGEDVGYFSYSYSSYGTLTIGQASYSNVIQIYGNDGATFWNSDPLYPIVMMETEDWPFDWIYLRPGVVGVDDITEEAFTFTPYPNPSTGLVHVDRLPTEVSYSVIDPVGRVVLTGTRTNDLIDLGSLPAGSYQLLLNSPVSKRAVPVMKVDRGGE